MTLLARYKLDGNAQDSEGTAHGTAIDVTWAPSQLIDGGGEARLNGSTSRIDTAIQYSTETAASLPLWFRPGKGAGHLIGQHDGTDGLAIEQTETGKIRLVVGATASAEVTVYPGWYHHGVAVYDAGTATLYLDNEAAATVTATVAWPAVPVTLGARADGSAPLECDVVDARGYDQALDSNMVNELIGGIPRDGLIAYYPLTVDARDQVGNNHGVSYGATATDKGHEFDGVDDWIASQYNLGFSGDPEFTISYYAYWSGSAWTTNFPSGVGNNSTGQASRGLSTTWNAGRIALDFWGNRFRANAALNVRTPYLVTFTKTAGLIGSTCKLYVNGVEQAGAVEGVDTTPDIIDSEMVIGRLDDVRYFQGRIWDIVIYNRALSQSEIQAINNARNYYLTSAFPFLNQNSLKHLGPPPFGWNPRGIPRLPNETAIPASGRSTIQDTPDIFDTLGWFDQRDGSGRDRLDINGVVSEPSRQGVIEGNITDENGSPVSRRVRAFERRTGRLVREAWSNQAGYYRFADLDPSLRFTILAHDHTGIWNAVVADNVQSEVQ